MSSGHDVVLESDLRDLVKKIIEDRTAQSLRGASGGTRRDVLTAEQMGTYTERAIFKHAKVRTVFRKEEPLALSRIFVDLDATVHANQLLKLDKDVLSRVRVQNLLKLNRRWTLTGTGGLGKTTLMRRFLLDALSEGKHLPVFLELRDVAAGIADLLGSVADALTVCGVRTDRESAHTLLEAGKVLLLLDGYDEVAPLQRDPMKREIIKIADLYPSVPIVLTSRPDEDLSFWAGFASCSLLPLSPSRAREVVDKIVLDQEAKASFLEYFDHVLLKRFPYLCEVPLFICIMLSTFSGSGPISGQGSSIYKLVFEAMWSKHDWTSKGFRRHLQSDLSMGEFLGALSALAFATYVEGNRLSFTETDITPALAGPSSLLKSLQIGRRIDSAPLLADLVMALCVLMRDGAVYTYIHRTFQEYYTARYIEAVPEALSERRVRNFLLRRCEQDMVVEFLHELNPGLTEKSLFVPFALDVAKKIGYAGGPTRREHLVGFLRFASDTYEIANHSTPVTLNDTRGVLKMTNFVARRFDTAVPPTRAAIRPSSALRNSLPSGKVERVRAHELDGRLEDLLSMFPRAPGLERQLTVLMAVPTIARQTRAVSRDASTAYFDRRNAIEDPWDVED